MQVPQIVSAHFCPDTPEGEQNKPYNLHKLTRKKLAISLNQNLVSNSRYEHVIRMFFSFSKFDTKETKSLVQLACWDQLCHEEKYNLVKTPPS